MTQPKHKIDMGITNTEALILANQAIILQALAIAIGSKEVVNFINPAVDNIHNILKDHHERNK